jgi:hypothetical protein
MRKLTLCNTASFMKPLFVKLDKKFPISYEVWMYTTVFQKSATGTNMWTNKKNKTELIWIVVIRQ